MAATMLSRKAVASVRPTFATSRRSVVIRASAEPEKPSVPTEAPINAVSVQAAVTPAAVPVAAAPAAPSLYGELPIAAVVAAGLGQPCCERFAALHCVVVPVLVPHKLLQSCLHLHIASIPAYLHIHYSAGLTKRSSEAVADSSYAVLIVLSCRGHVLLQPYRPW
jgi:hypothetical protein